MKKYVLIYAPSAQKDLRSLDNSVADRILNKIKKYSEAPDARVTAKALTGTLTGLYRYRVGDYRIIFSVDEQEVVTILTILNIAHRKDVYR